MKKGIDYDWTSISKLSSRDFICGHCGRDVSSEDGYHGTRTYPHGAGTAKRTVYILICHKCSRPNYFDDSYQSPVFEKARTEFPEEIAGISQKFIKIFNQSEYAENKGHDDVAGVGYGKAFEFLIKDYLIYSETNTEEQEKIKKQKLHNCIQDRIENEKIKKAAAKAKILRNDETHYEKKYTDQDVSSLKRLIHATVHWIEVDLLTEADL